MSLAILDVLCINRYVARKVSVEAAVVLAELQRDFEFSAMCDYNTARKNSLVKKNDFDIAVIQLVKHKVVDLDVHDGRKVLKQRNL